VQRGLLFLVLDLYSVLRTAKFRQRAQEVEIQLLFVPAGVTSTIQSLDRRIFGELKSRARVRFAQWVWQPRGFGAPPADAIEILIEAWASISSKKVRKAWSLEETKNRLLNNQR
jgi:hypothetical protein